MRKFIGILSLLFLSFLAIPLFDTLIQIPTGRDFYSVGLNPPLPGIPSYAYASRARWDSIIEDNMKSFMIPLAYGQIGGGLFGNRAVAHVIEVGKSGARFSTICGMLPGVGGANSCGDATDVCAPGSAYAAADALTNDPNNPVIIHVNPGVYNECVHFDNVSDISLVLDSGALIRPIVAAMTDVGGGVVRFGVTTATRNSTARIEVTGGKIWNDAWSAPEAALQINPELGPLINPSPSTDIYVHDITLIGQHDGWQAYGTELTTDDDLPRFILARAKVVGGDAITHKGWSITRVFDNDILSQPNYCESTDVPHLIQSSGTLASANDAQDLILPVTETVPAAAPSTTNRFYVGRKISIDPVGTCNTGGVCGAVTALICSTGQVGDTCAVDADCNGGYAQIFQYDASTRTISLTPQMPFIPDNTCTYTISPVTHNNGQAYLAGDVVDSPCTDMDWSTMRGTVANTDHWKNTCGHASFATGTAPPGDSVVWTNNRCTININDFGPHNGTSGCKQQNHVNAFLAYQGKHTDLRINGLDAEININSDLQDSILCVNPVAAVSFTGDTAYSGIVEVSGVNATINNRGDADEEMICLNAKSTGTAFTVKLNDTYCDINNTVGSYVGTSVTLAQANNTSLSIGNLTSPDPITTSGTIAGWSEKCFILPPTPIAGWAAGSDNIDIPIMDANVGVQMAYVGCRCIGTCGAANGTFDFEDEAGNAIVAGVVCGEPNAVITWTDMRADADALIPAGSSPRFDTNATPTTTTDQIQFCYRYSTSRFAP